MKKIVVVGQTPPPYGGQAMMIQRLLEGSYKDCRLVHVRMSFSKEMNEIGKASIYKVFHLFNVIAKIYFARFFKRAQILYYPPSGPNKVPILRDIIILISTRYLFKKTIFHFHAGGLSEMRFNSLVLNFLFKKAYYYADCAILLSEHNPKDGKGLKAKIEMVVPNGIEDNYEEKNIKIKNKRVKILFVSIITESKGILVLLEACKNLKMRGLDFTLEVMGHFESANFEKKVKDYIRDNALSSHLSFLGVLSGKEKHNSFFQADIFCFPTFFESETFGLVLLEAMQNKLPIVATSWRGVKSIIDNGVNGFLVEPKDSTELSDRLESLIRSPELRIKIGEQGRKMYLEKYTQEKFYQRMTEVFNLV